MQFLRMGGTDPYYNLALEEYILTNRMDGDYLLLWQNDNTIVVGLHQNTLEEIDTAYVEEQGIRVVRRRTGGGAVYHDLGNLNFSFITDMREAAQADMSAFTRPVVAALTGLGLVAEASGRNDITAGGRKISGNAQSLYKKRILHHGTLLFDSDLTVLSRALKPRPEKFQSKSVKSVRGRVGNILEIWQEAHPAESPLGLSAFERRLQESFSSSSVCDQLLLSEEEQQAVLKLREEKYISWDWNYGRSPQFTFKNHARFSGGSLEVFLDAKGGRIRACRFYGDFMALNPVEAISQALAGRKLEEEDLRSALGSFNLPEYFGSITLDEVVALLLNLQEA